MARQVNYRPGCHNSELGFGQALGLYIDENVPITLFHFKVLARLGRQPVSAEDNALGIGTLKLYSPVLEVLAKGRASSFLLFGR